MSGENLFAIVLRDTVFPILVEHLKKEKKIDITIEELIKIYKLKIDDSGANSHVKAKPPQLNGMVTKSDTGRSRKEAVTDANRCNYFFKKGDKKGERCPQPRLPDSELCKACSRKKGATGSGSTTTKTSKNKKNSNKSQDEGKAEESEEEGLVCNKIEDREDLYLSKDDGFVLRSKGDDYILIGIHQGDENNVDIDKLGYKLTKNQAARAKKNGLIFDDKITVEDEKSGSGSGSSASASTSNGKSDDKKTSDNEKTKSEDKKKSNKDKESPSKKSDDSDGENDASDDEDQESDASDDEPESKSKKGKGKSKKPVKKVKK